MKLPFDVDAYDVGIGNCSLHGETKIYAMFLGMNFETKNVRVGVFCATCYSIYKDNTAVTEMNMSIKEFADRMYFDDPNRDN